MMTEASARRCLRTPGCPGMVDETGYCDRCGHPALPDRAPAAAAQPKPSSTATFVIANLVELPVLSFDQDDQRPVTSIDVPESKRRCAMCDRPVGRSMYGRPAPDQGFCNHCGTGFAFPLTPDLRPGDVIAEQYTVERCLAHGGMGWVYLAHDSGLDKHVVLKGLMRRSRLDQKMAKAERDALKRLDHPNIVRIFTVTSARPDPDSGPAAKYIVMEYLQGMTLAELLIAARDRHRPEIALPLEHVLAYGHEILAALDYLHEHGLVYCDMKPDNVMRTADRVKVIDLGAVSRPETTTGPLVRTAAYQVSEDELAKRGPTVRSDLFAVGKTLEELRNASAPASAGRTAVLGVTSLQLLIERAAHRDYNLRFASAREMSAQLVGVLREVTGKSAHRQPDVSSLFATTEVLLDASLGAVPGLAGFTGSAGHLPNVDIPTAASMTLGLPVPQPTPDDPSAAYLGAVSASDPRSLLLRLEAVRPVTTEVQLAKCRANLAARDLTAAARELDAAVTLAAKAGGPITANSARQLARVAPGDWRLIWHLALLTLARDDVVQAEEAFDAVYRLLPGETAPKLALGYCAERAGRQTTADGFYQTVWHRDPMQANAAFGLVRGHLSRGARDEAVAILDTVPPISRHYDAARIAAVRVLINLPAAPTTVAEVNDAINRLTRLRLDDGAPTGASRERLTAALRLAALELAAAGVDGLAPGPVLGAEPSERSIRQLLEESMRSLAGRATVARDHSALIDRANSVRPTTWR